MTSAIPPDSSQANDARPVSSMKFLDLRPSSDNILEKIGYWAPLVPAWEPLKKTLNSSLRLACISEERLFQGLRFEGELLPLTPQNWKWIIDYGKPDMLLMESIWSTATGHWHMGQCQASPHGRTLLEMVERARTLSIPTVFWMTKGHEYHEIFKDFSRHFDYVFCADPRAAELLRAEGVAAEVLLPCVQPALYNPFRLHEHYSALDLGFLFDGWADLDRLGDALAVLKDVREFGLAIVESRYQLFRGRAAALPDYKDNILGCVTPQVRLQALKYARASLSFAHSLSTRTTRQWMDLEAAACRLPVLHQGAFAAEDPRKDVAIELPEERDFLVELVRMREDDLYRERLGHLGWRRVHTRHTFAHRMQQICKAMGITHDWEEHPKASLITPTYRRHLLPRCVRTFERQTYPNKELILVFNGADVPSHQELGLESPREDVKVANVPGELFAGACLNQGHLLASGAYCFRLDDDDHYGDNYVWDMILQARSVDADLFGKPPAPLLFEGEQTVYWRSKYPPLCVVNTDLLASGKVWLGGNSIAGRIDLFRELEYDDVSYGAADSSLFYKLRRKKFKDSTIVFTDSFNMVAERRAEQQTHTWKVDPKRIRDNARAAGVIAEVMI